MEVSRVLVVEDKPDIREQRAELLTKQGYKVEAAGGIDDAMILFRQEPFPVVVTDLQMEGMEDGLEVARRIRTITPETKVIIITGTNHRKAAVDGYRVNVFAYVEKGRQRKGRDSLREAIGRAFDELREQKVRKYMLSFLTHTMRNTFAGAGPALEQALARSDTLASKLDSDQHVYQMISNLAFLKTALTTVDSMLEAYKLLIREPENLRQAWRADQGEDAPLAEVLDKALGAVLSRLFCQEAQIPTLKRLAASHGNRDRKELKKQFFSDFLLADGKSRISAEDWLAKNFPILEVSDETPSARLSRSGLRFNLLFAIVSELCFNAIKYSDGRQPIRIQWRTRKENYELKIVNTCSPQSTNQVGSEEGRNFIATLLNPLGGIAVDYVEPERGQDLFEAKLAISQTFLNGDNN